MMPTVRLSRWHSILEWSLACSLLLLVLTIAHGAHIQTNWSQRHWEDQLFVAHVDQQIPSLRACLTGPSLWPGLYRPLTTNCYYFLGSRLFAHQIEWYHAINVLLYGINALLLYWLVRQLLSFPFALLAMAVFASRSAHVEVITNTVEFQILAATCFALVALILFIQALRYNRRRLLFSVYFWLLLAILSKEATVAVAAMLPFYGWLSFRPLRRFYLVVACIGVAGTGIFWTLLRYVTAYQPTGFTFTREPALVWRNISAHFWSFVNRLVRVEDEWIMSQSVEAMATSVVGQAVVLFFLVAILILLAVNHAISDLGRSAAMGGIVFFIAVLPYSFFDDRLFMRYGYFAHAGLSLTVAALTAWAAALLRNLWRQGGVPVPLPLLRR